MLGDDPLHAPGARQRCPPFVFRELRGFALHVPLARGQRVVVHADAVHELRSFAHQHVGPCKAAAVGPTRDAQWLRAVRRLHEGDVVAVEIRVVLRPHVSAAAPGLIAHREILHLPRFVAPVLAAQLRERRVACPRSCIRATPPFRAACRCPRWHSRTHRRRCSSAKFMNSCVPKELSSTTPPQWVLTLRGRCSRGPMPSRQLYSSAKQPPGQRNTGTPSSRSAAITSLR